VRGKYDIGVSVLAILSITAIALGREGVLAGGKTKPRSSPSAATRLPVGPEVKPLSKAELSKAFGNLPLSFEPNKGQAPAGVDFVTHASGYALLVSAQSATVVTPPPNTAANAFTSKLTPAELRQAKLRKGLINLFHTHGTRPNSTNVAFEGSNPKARAFALNKLVGETNYFIGNDKSKWHTQVPNYAKVKFSQVYPGVDVVYYGDNQRLEFDLDLSPGADPGLIKLKFDPDKSLSFAKNGNLEIRSNGQTLFLRKPVAYQGDGRHRDLVSADFALLGRNRVGIRVGTYDATRSLVIDPVLAYSTFASGTSGSAPYSIAVDAQGDAYIGGYTASTDFPIVNGYSSTGNATDAAFIAKLDPTGTTLLYSTYLGGTSAYGDLGSSLAVDSAQNVYLTGIAYSSDFPTLNAYQTTNNDTYGGNVFVARIDTTQTGSASLIYSTFLGGGGNSVNPYGLGDEGLAIATDGNGLAYVTGITASDTSVAAFPTTVDAYQATLSSTNGNAFLSVVDTSSSGANSLIYSTYLGGDGVGVLGDEGLGIAVDGLGNAFLVGQTSSDSSNPFPTTPSAYQSSLLSSNGNVFVTEIATMQSGGAGLIYSTYFGGSTSDPLGDYSSGIALDSGGKVYIAGITASSDFPITSGAYQTSNSTNGKAFVSKFDLTQSGINSLTYSTFLGGSGPYGDGAYSVAVDQSGNAYVAGGTSSTDFPTTVGAYQTTLSSSTDNAFLTELNSTGTALVYSTYLGGSSSNGDQAFGVALDSIDDVYLAGAAGSSDFPTTTGAYQTSWYGPASGFLAKLAFSSNPGISAFLSPTPNASGWNNSPVTVSFLCVPAVAAISSCTSPATISTDGAGQTVTGIATDASSNTANVTATVNLDATAPSLSITSPTSGSTVSNPYVSVSGTVSDSLSGIASVSCNDVPASISGTSFSCTVSLFAVSNSIMVNAMDLAGNTATASVSITVSMTTPSSLTVAPANVNMFIGGSQAFTATDQSGARRPDVAWSISNSSIASFVSGEPDTLTGNAAGTVTLTAAIGSTTGTASITVLSSAPSLGTTLWSAPSISGYTTQKVVQAQSAPNGPDLYSIASDSSGDILVQALGANGRQFWQTTLTGTTNAGLVTGVGVPDGGVLVESEDTSSLHNMTLTHLDPVSGSQTWQYATLVPYRSAYFSPNSAVNDDLSFVPAIGLDGTVYVVDQDSTTGNDTLDAINGSTGSLITQFDLPLSSLTNGDYCDDRGDVEPWASPTGPPVVGPDGSVYLLVESTQTTYSHDSSCTASVSGYSESLQLMQIPFGGSPAIQTIDSYGLSDIDPSFGPPYRIPGDLIPDGHGGVLASWSNRQHVYTAPAGPPVAVADIDTTGTYKTIVTGMLGNNIWRLDTLIAGDQSAFLTDGKYVTSFSPTPTLSQNWSYAASAYRLTVKQASPGGGVVIEDSSFGEIQLDSSGSASTADSSRLGSTPFDLNSWLSASGVSLLYYPSGSNGIQNVVAKGAFPLQRGNRNGQSKPPRCSLQAMNCVLAAIVDLHNGTDQVPAAPRNITYGVFSLHNDVLSPLYDQEPVYGGFEISWSEAFNLGNTSGANICNVEACTNLNDGTTNFAKGKLTDHIDPGFGTLLISQTNYTVDNESVPVFFPHPRGGGQYEFTGAASQNVAGTSSLIRITQTPPLVGGIRCSKTVFCSTTPP
jgi:hypothetical protein